MTKYIRLFKKGMYRFCMMFLLILISSGCNVKEIETQTQTETNNQYAVQEPEMTVIDGINYITEQGIKLKVTYPIISKDIADGNLVGTYMVNPVKLGNGLGEKDEMAYIVAGIIAGPAVPYIPTVSDPANIKIWADIGVIFLLFAMGLEFSFKKLMTVGGTAVIASITIVSGMMFLGYTAGNALGFSHLSSIFLGGMLSMSSTAIVFKAFDDMGLRGQKFTGVVLGVLVVEDLVAVVLMVLLSTLAVSKQVEGMEMLESILKLGAFLIFWSLLGIYLIPSFLKKIKPFLNDETLLIIALGFCLGMVMIAAKAGFSSALGAFVMGSLLAETIEAEKIEKLVKPVKDLFAAIFFG